MRQRAYATNADRQRAFRERKRNVDRAASAPSCVTFDDVFRPVPRVAPASSDEWYTPRWVIDAAREAMGGIDLDPASNTIAQAVVCARQYYTQADNGLVRPWAGRVWCNPPYSDPCPWVRKLIAHYRAGDVPAALLLLNVDSSTAWAFSLLQGGYPVCFLSSRIAFVTADGKSIKGNKKPQWIWYFGDRRRRFAAAFGRYGSIR